MSRIGRIFRDWMLVIAMIAGVAMYLLYRAATPLHVWGPQLLEFVHVLQPALLFSMLFLTFCKVEPSQLRPSWWMLWGLLIQGGVYVALAGLVMIMPRTGLSISVEAAMLCMICPTATACAVVTGKLGGNMAGVLTYTILVNMMVALLIPAVTPLLYPSESMNFMSAFLLILRKVFPLLIAPCLLAWIVRYCFPRLHAILLKSKDMAFYMWAVSLTFAIVMSTRAIISHDDNLWVLAGIALASLLACAFQFWAGKTIGGRYGERITGGQVMGQKNTVFAIWVGYTFMDPIVSVAGGFYSIWHNCFNTWQLQKASHRQERQN